MSPPRHELEFELGLEDLVRFNEAVMSNDSRFARSRLLVPLLAVGVMLAGWFRHDTSFVAMGLVLLVLSFVVSPAGTAFIARRYFRRALAQGRRVGELGRWRVVLDDDGFTAITSTHRSELEWEQVLDVTRRRDGLFIMSGRRSGFYLPRTAATPERFEELSRFAEDAWRAANPRAGTPRRSPFRTSMVLWVLMLAVLAMMWFLSSRRAAPDEAGRRIEPGVRLSDPTP